MIDSTGNAVVASIEWGGTLVDWTGTTVTWVTNQGNTLASARVDALVVQDMVLDSRDNVYLAGYVPEYKAIDSGAAFNGCVDFNQYQKHAVVAKVNGTTRQVEVVACVVAGYGRAVAVTSAGDILVAGIAQLPKLRTTPKALKPSSEGQDGFLAKLDASGQLVYATYIGGSGTDAVSAMTLGNDGSIYLTGTTDSAGLGTPGAFRQHRIGSSLYRSTDGGSTWQAIGRGLPWTGVRQVERHPRDPNLLYAIADYPYVGEDTGLFRSTDNGQTWSHVCPFPGEYKRDQSLLLAPDSTIYLYDGLQIHHSTNGGVLWTTFPLPNYYPIRLQVGPDGAIYQETGLRTISVSRDRGESWRTLAEFESQIHGYYVGSNGSSLQFVNAGRNLYRSRDAGLTWNNLGEWDMGGRIAFHPSHHSIIYNLRSGKIRKSDDQGSTWATSNYRGAEQIVGDASNPDVLYSYNFSGSNIYRYPRLDAEPSRSRMDWQEVPTSALLPPTTYPANCYSSQQLGSTAL